MFYFTILQHPGPRTEHQNLRIYHGHQPSEFSMEADCFFGQLEKNQWLEPKTLHVQHAGYSVQSHRSLGGFHF